MYSKAEAKEKLKELIIKFEAHPQKDNLSEEKTRGFIDELFEILGWDMNGEYKSQFMLAVEEDTKAIGNNQEEEVYEDDAAEGVEEEE